MADIIIKVCHGNGLAHPLVDDVPNRKALL
jgi:hypothetical protein